MALILHILTVVPHPLSHGTGDEDNEQLDQGDTHGNTFGK